jgi:hypothetical protein
MENPGQDSQPRHQALRTMTRTMREGGPCLRDVREKRTAARLADVMELRITMARYDLRTAGEESWIFSVPPNLRYDTFQIYPGSYVLL